MSRAAVAAYLGVCLRTVRHWETGRNRVPWSAVRLLRLRRLGDLGGLHDAWSGWTLHERTAELVSPNGYRFAPHRLAVWPLLCEQARFWRQDYARRHRPIRLGVIGGVGASPPRGEAVSLQPGAGRAASPAEDAVVWPDRDANPPKPLSYDQSGTGRTAATSRAQRAMWHGAPGLVYQKNKKYSWARFPHHVAVWRGGGMIRIMLDPVARRLRRMRKVLSDSVTALHFEADGEACATGRRYYRAVFLTLTYREADGWQPGHIGDFTRALRRWFQRQDETLRLAWVGELQGRGAVHYHAVLFVPRHLRLPCPDRCGWWPHGLTKVETARNPVGYLTKYASKALMATMDILRDAGYPKVALVGLEHRQE